MLLPIYEDRTAVGACIGEVVINTISCLEWWAEETQHAALSSERFVIPVVLNLMVHLTLVGRCGYAGVPLDSTIATARLTTASHTSDIGCGRLHHHARYVR